MAIYSDDENTTNTSEETTDTSDNSSNTDTGSDGDNGDNNDSGSNSDSENTSESGTTDSGDNGDSESGSGSSTDTGTGTDDTSGGNTSSETGTGSSTDTGTGTDDTSGGNTSSETGTGGSGTSTTDTGGTGGDSTTTGGTDSGSGGASSGEGTTTPTTPTTTGKETTGDDIVEPPKIPTESDAQEEAAKAQETTESTTTKRTKLPKFVDPTMDRSSKYYKGEDSLSSVQTNRTVLLNHPLTVELAGSDNLRRVKQEDTFKVENLELAPTLENVLSKIDKPDAALKVKVIENNINSITDELKRLADDADKAIKYWEELQKKPSQELLRNKLDLLQQLYTCGAIAHDVYADELGIVAKELGYSFTISKESGGKKKKKNP